MNNRLPSTRVSYFIIKYLLIIFLALNITVAQENKGWENADKIVNSIIVPLFPERDYNITDFGAVGDGVTDCLPAIKEAINKCNIEGGGRVILSSGTFFVKGPIHLKSHVKFSYFGGSNIKI